MGSCTCKKIQFDPEKPGYCDFYSLEVKSRRPFDSVMLVQLEVIPGSRRRQTKFAGDSTGTDGKKTSSEFARSVTNVPDTTVEN